jgi:hypothetical protein
MNSLRNYAIVWFSGLLAGVVIMERWHLTGKRLIPPPARDGAGGPASASPTGDKPKVSAALIAGAKDDAVRVHHFVKRVTPWTSNPAPTEAEARRWGQVATPNETPSQPA